MTDDEIAKLKSLAEAATPGEWRAEGWDMEEGLSFIPILGGGSPGSAPEHCLLTVQSYGQSPQQCDADAEFIAASRTAIPALLAALASAEERARRAEGEVGLGRCDCGETTPEGCASRPARHCGNFDSSSWSRARTPLGEVAAGTSGSATSAGASSRLTIPSP
jgi:hypothetical protein